MTLDPFLEGLALIQEEDLVYEEECLRNPYILKCWLRYFEFKKDSSYMSRVYIYERALKELPGSYKIWKAYLDLRVSVVLEGLTDSKTGLLTRKLPPRHKEWELLNECFERSIILCNKFPAIWLMYLSVLMHQCTPSRTRRTFDRALKSLPITQNGRIWELYIKFAKYVGGETAVCVYRRYLKLEGDQLEAYVDMLVDIKPPKYAEAAKVLAAIVENPNFKSKQKKTNYELWSELCDLICDHAMEMDLAVADNTACTGNGTEDKVGVVERLDVDRILRAGITLFSDQVGRFWVALAQWWALKGEFERSRDVHEEGISKVMTVRDFTIIFDAYAKSEEALLISQVKLFEQGESGVDEIEVDMRMARFEMLLDRRPFLVNNVLLRQNVNNVSVWEKRIALFYGDNNDGGKEVAGAYAEATSKINPRKAHGKFNMLWVHYAEYFEQKGDLVTARKTFEVAVKVNFKRVEDLAEVWCQWAEMELRNENFDAALTIMGRATAPPRGTKILHHNIRYTDESLFPQQRLFKCLKLWSFYVDLEESIGTVESTKNVYDRILELKIANAQIICNFAAFLEEQNWFEESYKVYERGVDLFGYPIAADLWTLYLNKFVGRFKGTKLERTRELFESAVEKVPPNYAKPFYLMYAKLEEEHGLARHSMRIYDRATKAVADVDRFDMYLLYISKATQFFGLTSTREIYERAIETLPDKKAREMCVKFAALELTLGEVDRARAVYGYASQFSEPRLDAPFWKIWHEFEIKHGNEDTFKEMLRIKRSVQAKFNTEVQYISAQLMAKSKGEAASIPAASGDAMQALDTMEGESRVSGFVKASEPIATDLAMVDSGSDSDESEDDAA